MGTLTFDTLKFANRLKSAGVPAIQAEAEADALSEVLESNLGELVTKEDLRHEIGDLRKDMDAKFAGIDARFEKTESTLRQEMTNMNAKMSDMKFELLKWIIGLAIAQAGLLLAVLKFFPINS